MNTEIRRLLKEEKIDGFGVIPFSECRVINPALLARSCVGWTPASVILLAVPYYTGEYPGRNVSLYAVPGDYHRYFRGLYERIGSAFSDAFPGSHFIGFADHSPIGEVSAAARAGLGVIGDMGQLIHPVYGSYFFIGEIMTDAVLEYDVREIGFCRHCGACVRACPLPTGCLSAETQKKGALSPGIERLIRQQGIAWGCDVCRTVCPENQNVPITPIDFFKKDLKPTVTSEEIEAMSKEEFSLRAYGWRGKSVILRNLAFLEDNVDKEET